MEKFGLLNLLKAIEALSPPRQEQKNDSVPADSQTQAEPYIQSEQKAEEKPNVMASVLQRHEQMSMKLKNRR